MLVTAETEKEKLEKKIRLDSAMYAGGLTGGLGGIGLGYYQDLMSTLDPKITGKQRIKNALIMGIPSIGMSIVGYKGAKNLKKHLTEYNEKYGHEKGLKKTHT